MSIPYVAPAFDKEAFNCPFCAAYSRMIWSFREDSYRRQDLKGAECTHCNKSSFWTVSHGDSAEDNGFYTDMIYPRVASAPMPHKDMPENIRDVYMEARDIAARSARAAGALLRLCIELMCEHLKPGKGKINEKIGELHAEGMPQEIIDALDTVRVIGNNLVHPGKLDLQDDSEVVQQLFTLVNIITEFQISRKKKLEELKNLIPQGAKDGILRRNKKAEKAMMNGR